MSAYYICPHRDCREQVDPPDEDGLSYCKRCDEQVEAEKVIDLDRDDIAYEKTRNRGWPD
jgi:hypothetical protein